MEERLILYETAIVAKEKRFDWDCYNEYHSKGYSYREGKPGYSTVTIKKGQLERAGKGQVFRNLCNNFSAPTQSLLQKWLRDIYNIHVYANHKKFGVVSEDGYYYHIGKSTSNRYYGKFSSYEDALEAGLLEALKLI